MFQTVHNFTVPLFDAVVFDVIVVVIVSVAFTTTVVECLVSVEVVTKVIESTAIVVVIISYHINFTTFVKIAVPSKALAIGNPLPVYSPYV